MGGFFFRAMNAPAYIGNGGAARGCAGQNGRVNALAKSKRVARRSNHAPTKQRMRWPYENARFGVLKNNNQKKDGIARIGLFGAIGAISRLLRRYQRQTKNGRWDAPAKNGDGGTARGCAGENGDGHGDGMRQPR